MVRVMTVLGVLLAVAAGQTERWVYRYNGPGNNTDWVSSLVAGADGNIYAAGESYGTGTSRDFINQDFLVISLTPSDSERWVYRYNGPGNATDGASQVVTGADGNVYAAGQSGGSGTYGDFTVVSLTPSGTQRWVYRYNGPGNSGDCARSIVAGADGNIYAAGQSCGSGTRDDFTVISLTSSGDERWVYRYNGPGDYYDWANSIVAGADGSIYAAGMSTGSGTDADFTVISLTPLGSERWVCRHNGKGNDYDEAYSIIAGADGSIYAAGTSYDSMAHYDFTVISLTPSGTVRWVYCYNGSGNGDDGANSIVAGADGNVYAAGFSRGQGTGGDFTVISLTPTGSERWVYRYSGPGNDWDVANSLVVGPDGNVYAAGYSTGSGTDDDFAVISLTASGSERWVYRYNGPGNSYDDAYSIIADADGSVYAAGRSIGNVTYYDFTVISLEPAPTGVAEAGPPTSNNALGLAAVTIRNHALDYTLKLPEPATVSLSLCDLQGRKLSSWQVPAPKGTSQHTRNLSRGHDAESCPLTTGVYFLTAGVPGKKLRASRKLITVK